MKQFTAFLKKLQLRKILSIFLAGSLLLFSTACNSGDLQGARPDNPPVQAGGSNNPYKNGGDSYTNYKASTDPKVNQNPQGKRADAQLISNQLIAANNDLEILYPGADEQPAGLVEKEKELPKISKEDFAKPQPGGEIQRERNVGERIGDRLGTVGDTFKEASGFLKDKADEAGARPEAQSNPALH